MLAKSNQRQVYDPSAATQLDPEARKLLALGQLQGWAFALLGQAPLPEKPVRLGDWLIVPAMEDSSEIPERALERIQAIFAAGLRPKGFVLVHEAPKLLPGPSPKQQKAFGLKDLPSPNASQLAGGIGAVLISVLAVASSLAVAAITTIGTSTGLIVAAALLDPILVAVTEDDYWIEIDRWWN